MIYNTMNSAWVDESSVIPVFLFNTPEVKQTTEFLLKMQSERVIPDLDINFGNKNYTSDRMIETGDIVFWVGFVDDSYDSFEYNPGLLPLPGFIQNASLYGLPTFFISKNTSNPEGCWEWFQYFSKKPAIFRGIPLRNSILNSPQYENLVGTEMASLYRLIVDYMMDTPYDQKERENAILYEGPNSWFYQILGGVKYDDDLDVPLQNVQFKSEAYLNCMLNLGGDSEDNYQTCMKLVDPDS